ncbi:polyprenyl synthetase family protein [Phanerochaete sordida]|uniref:(2E,6E)-farnesyl diphosphate synthase n=1 Tax=Phanerochaete sordida TaxID=48140 RepID=A0A9P3GKL5_9APHY|nr:polyprenyl synthetase family protein [Phanerochaete sordida]
MSPQVDRKARDRARFETVFKTVRDELVEHVRELGFPCDVVNWFSKNLDYNVPGGKLVRGLNVVETVEVLKDRPLTSKEYFQAAVLGWTVELLEACFLVSDDLIDSSVTRRGRPCWHRTSGVGLIAVNDASMLESSIYWLLKKHFRAESCYVDILELFHETIMRTEIGQLLDLITASGERVGLSTFSLSRHHKILLFKVAYYSFYLPVALAMRLCGIPNQQGHDDPYKAAASVLLPLGVHFQVQDDYLDFLGTSEGSAGTDIVEGKCTWCICTALAVASPAQRGVLDAHYGRRDVQSERKVRDIFKELSIQERFSVYEEKSLERVTLLLKRIEEGGAEQSRGGSHSERQLRREVFKIKFDKVHRRLK